MFRREDEVERVAKIRKDIKQSKKANEHVIAGRLLMDEDEFQRRLKKKQEHREFLDNFNKEMGVEAKQARTKAFMLKRTGRQLLDPTSRIPVKPSEVLHGIFAFPPPSTHTHTHTHTPLTPTPPSFRTGVRAQFIAATGLHCPSLGLQA